MPSGFLGTLRDAYFDQHVSQEFRVLDEGNLFLRQSYQLREALHHDINGRLAQSFDLSFFQPLFAAFF